MRVEVYQVAAQGRGQEQRDRRYAVVLQPDWLSLSTWIAAFTSTRARPTSFRPAVVINDEEMLVQCDQIATVDLRRFSQAAG